MHRLIGGSRQCSVPAICVARTKEPLPPLPHLSWLHLRAYAKLRIEAAALSRFNTQWAVCPCFS